MTRPNKAPARPACAADAAGMAAHERLLDGLIDYAEERNLPLERAASVLAELARQRTPERNLEIESARSRTKLEREINESEQERLIARVIMVTRVHSIAWTYYPRYHVVSPPRPYSRFHAGPWEKVTWKPRQSATDYYIDDLFLDPNEWQFWMPEPYLDGLPACQAIYSSLTSTDGGTLKGTSYRKVNPEAVRQFKEARSGRASFEVKECGDAELYMRRRYGSKGWKERIAFLPSWAKAKWK